MRSQLKNYMDSAHYDNDTKIIVVRVFEDIERAAEFSYQISTPFLEPEIRHFIETGCKKYYKDVLVKPFGVFKEYERAMMIIGDNGDSDNGNSEDLSQFAHVLRIHSTDTSFKPTHRNVLGSVLGLGIKREKIGDIIIDQQQIFIAVDASLSNFIQQNLFRVGSKEVSCEWISFEDVGNIEIKTEEIFFSVKSLRADGVIAEGFNLSRDDAAGLCESGKVKINHVEIQSKSKAVENGDLISVRGFGRLKIRQCDENTKKGRIRVVANRYN